MPDNPPLPRGSRPPAAALSGAPSGGAAPRPPNRWRRKLLLGGGLLLLSASSIVPSYLYYLTERQPVPWSRLWSEVVAWLLWLVLLPVILWAARRFPLERQAWRRSVPAHFAIGSAVALAYALLVVAKNQLILALGTGLFAPHFFSLLPGYLFGGFQFYFLVYWMIVAVVHAFDYQRKYRERELQSSRLEANLMKAQLQVLKMQLEPHFLFNTLNAISALVHRDPDGADRMICLLSDFLRLSLNSAEREEVPLEEELRFLEHYLEIQKTRFGDRLAVDLDVEEAARACLVPNLVLQPLVENAIRHGIGVRSAPLQVSISARRLPGERLEVRVGDNGPGLPAGEGGVKDGVGLGNTRARLRQLYGADHRFEIRNSDQGGALALLVIPQGRAAHAGLEPELALAAGR